MEVTTTMDTHSSFRKKEVWNNLQEAFGRVPLVWKGRGQKGHAQSLILGLHPQSLSPPPASSLVRWGHSKHTAARCLEKR